VDNGSYDPDGDPIDLTQDPPAPYPLGDTFVTLTVTDDKGASDSCTATVTVVDTTPPAVGVTIPSSGDALQDVATFTASASDNCAVSQVYFYLREASAPETPFGYEDLPATYTSGNWEYGFDSTAVDDGYYVVLAKAVDASGNVGWSSVPCSIRNWAIVELLPASQEYRAGRTMPVKFSLRIAAAVDPAMPFVYNEALEIKIYDGASLEQASQYGDHSNDYRIDVAGELYITNFKTSKTPTTYTVEIWRLNKGFMIDSFDFTTARR
jgi:hypothetical protein